MYRDNDIVNRCYQILDRAEIEYDQKERAFNMIKAEQDKTCLLGKLLVLELESDLYHALAEIIIA